MDLTRFGGLFSVVSEGVYDGSSGPSEMMSDDFRP